MKSLFLRILPVLVIVSVALVSCYAPGVMPDPNKILTPTKILATSAVPVSDDVWDRIVANKKIVVGTSWDYPPFSSVNPNLQVVGFDIALIGEIGHRLQIPVEIQNYAFEGLPGALQINQIDLAVAAMAITPERTTQMSFSPIYYVNQTAILARNDGLVTSITNFNQLAGLTDEAVLIGFSVHGRGVGRRPEIRPASLPVQFRHLLRGSLVHLRHAFFAVAIHFPHPAN